MFVFFLQGNLRAILVLINKERFRLFFFFLISLWLHLMLCNPWNKFAPVIDYVLTFEHCEVLILETPSLDVE